MDDDDIFFAMIGVRASCVEPDGRGVCSFLCSGLVRGVSRGFGRLLQTERPPHLMLLLSRSNQWTKHPDTRNIVNCQ